MGQLFSIFTVGRMHRGLVAGVTTTCRAWRSPGDDAGSAAADSVPGHSLRSRSSPAQLQLSQAFFEHSRTAVQSKRTGGTRPRLCTGSREPTGHLHHSLRQGEMRLLVGTDSLSLTFSSRAP